MKRFSLFLFALFALLMGVPPQAALAKAGDVVTNLSNLSNSKVYNIKSARGYLLYSANYTEAHIRESHLFHLWLSAV